MSARPLLMAALLRPKGGLPSRQNQARQGGQDHGSGRPPWSACRRMRRKCSASGRETGSTHAGRNGCSRGAREPDRRRRLGLRCLGSGTDPLRSEADRPPHRSNRKRITRDGRGLRRYCRRWKVERLFAGLQNFRRLVVRYERCAEHFLGMIHPRGRLRAP